MTDIYLHIFPQGSLSGSVITTVWVGIFVAAFFNLRFGWSMSGLVVPGYLVPLLIVKPWAGLVVIVEGILSYFVVLWIFEYMSKLNLWNSVFGRDRFFALLLSSVIVRILLDGWLLPIIGEMVNKYFAVNFDYRNHLNSFGLIIVALIANQFWKPGFFKGFTPLCVTIGLTYIIVRYGLMEYTNFSISNLGYMYEDIATSMLASPKAYIILLTTAFVASHMNLHYGWEYSGILIPSLISLLWYQPLKITASFIETFIILITAMLVLRLPFFMKTTIEGSRKILLFFNISYLYKFITAYFILWFMPEKKITDYYGFGYLLPSLLAIKMYDKEIAVRITRATIQTSFSAIILASALGFSLTMLPKWTENISPDYKLNSDIKKFPKQSLLDVIQKDKITLYQNQFTQNIIKPVPKEIEIFSSALRKLSAYTKNHNKELLAQAQWLLTQVNYLIKEIENKYLYIYEASPQRNWGIYVINLKPENNLLIEIPSPVDEKGTMKAGACLFSIMNAKAMSIGVFSKQKLVKENYLHILNNPNTFFHTFHKELSYQDVVQIRGYTNQSIRILKGLRKDETKINLPQIKSSLWIKSTLPPGLHLGILKKLIGNFDVEWGKTPMGNIQRETTISGFAELYLNRQDIRKLFFKQILTKYKVPVQIREQRIDGYFQDWLLNKKDRIAAKGSEKYIIPKPEELLFFDEEILKPLINFSKTEYNKGKWSQAGKEELQTIASAADVMGYNLIQYHHKLSGQNYLILMEKDDPLKKQYWGTYVIRLGNTDNFLIQIPRPLYELNVFEYGVSLFERLKAKALLIGGTHKDANLDGSADLARFQNITNLFNLVNQVILRESKQESMLIIQTRALGISEDQPLPETDILLGFNNGIENIKALGKQSRQLLEMIQEDEMTFQFVDGSHKTAGYEIASLPQALYLNETVNKNFVIIWLSPGVRIYYRQQTENWWQEVQFRVLEIKSISSYIQPYLENIKWEKSISNYNTLKSQILKYIISNDIIVLQSLIDKWPLYKFERFIDMNTRQSFLLVYSNNSKLILAANLNPRTTETSYQITDYKNNAQKISKFIESRAAWLSCCEK